MGIIKKKPENCPQTHIAAEHTEYMGECECEFLFPIFSRQIEKENDHFIMMKTIGRYLISY